MASYHLDVKAVKRSAGRSATAAAAYRHAERIECHREGRVHDYRAKAGVEASFIVVGDDAPSWAQDREALWNAAEAREVRKDGIVAREWELALPHELDGAGRRALAEGFARELVERYGVAADVAIHAPHREGDGRNWHAHVLTTTRALTAEGLGDKTRVLDVKQTGGPEIAHMRERWAEMQNHALERVGVAERVDHRSLVAQRAEALAHGDTLTADNLDRAPEVKLGPVVSGIERREERAAEREGHVYVPVTERGAQVHEARQARSLVAELARLRAEVRERAALARETYGHAREEGADQVRAGLAALRAAVQRQAPTHSREQDDEAGHERVASAAGIKERLARLMGREVPHHAQDGPVAGLPTDGLAHGEERRDRQGHERGHEAHGTRAHQASGADAIRERLDALRARERPAAEREAPAAGRPSHGRDRDWREHARAADEGHELDPINRRLRAVLGREQSAPGQDQGRSRAATREAHGLDPIDARLRAMLARERPVAQREDPLVVVVERLRDEAADAPSFATPREARAFREEMERRFDQATLARLGRGEETALAQVAPDRLDGLCLARAWLDSQGEPPRSEARLSLAYRINDAQHDARRERDGHEEDGHDWGL